MSFNQTGNEGHQNWRSKSIDPMQKALGQLGCSLEGNSSFR